MLNVLLFAIFSLPPWLIFISVAASISHFHTTAIKFPCNPSKVIGLLCFFISRSSSLSVFHVKADIRIKSKKRVGFVGVVFYLWNSGWLSALWRQKARVLEMQNFTPAYMKGWTNVRTYGRFFENQIFLPMVLRYKYNFKDNYWIFWKFSFFKYLHLKCFKFSLKITHFTSLYLNSTSFTVQ